MKMNSRLTPLPDQWGAYRTGGRFGVRFPSVTVSSEHALHPTDSGAPARSVRGRRDYAYESTNASDSTSDSCSDLDYVVTDESLVFVGW